jgi:hypothetical protein
MSGSKKSRITFALAAVGCLLLAVGGWSIRDEFDTLILPPDAVLPDGSRYHGEIGNGRFHGEGTLVGGNGERYEGFFRNGLFDGRGRYVTEDQQVFAGEFAAGKFTGQGSYEDAAGNRYEGAFKQWKFDGKGRYTTASGDTYEGDFRDGAFTGRGTLREKSGDILQGEFTAWVLDGKGRKKSADGSRYAGEFKDGLYHGKGVSIDSEGNRYAGEFENGWREGAGKLDLVAPKNGMASLKGKWQYDEYIDPEAAARRATRDAAVERALYAQNALLDSELTRLLPGEPGRIDLYFLGFAGYSDQDVFRREALFVRDMFNRDFGTEGRSVLLVNNEKSLHQYPLATSIALETALQRMAARMNPEDILFLYFTSHGSEDFHLSVEQYGVRLPDLGADRLAEMLAGLPVKWKVIAVSACYSGGFVPALRSDDTLVMTAASSKRQSFGCSNTSSMTYFGKAYFKESLPKADSFEDAFEKAVVLIEKWERIDIAKDNSAKHSQPQINVGRNISAQLDRWWRRRAVK